ncbi:NSP-interacting kinase 1-like protein [Tanacetum coccineum]
MMNDLFHLASSDHPGMMLTTTPFNGGNFLGWSRTIKMALGAKFKLGFIDGSSPKPAVIHNDYQRWSASDLWKELEERYGQSNGPLIYHVERELKKVSQGNSSIVTFFNKLKKFWDELHSLNGVPMCNCGKIRECTCGVTKKFLEIDSRSKLMQFLMRLNDDFEAVRNQILSMDPLPNLNKAYYIVQQVEKQKQVTHQVADPTAFFANNKGNQNVRKDNRSDGKSQGGDKKSCTFCNQDGHVYEQCFEK